MRLTDIFESDFAPGKFTDKQIKQAYGILNDPRYKGGDLTHAVQAIEKLAPGLSDHPGVQKAMKKTQEGRECNMTHEGVECPVHGLNECGSY